MDLIFKIVREAIQKDDAKRYAIITAALGLMSKHAGKFSKQILGHKGYYAQLYSSLKGWAMHGNREVQKIGARAVDNFLKEVISYHLSVSSSAIKLDKTIFRVAHVLDQ